MLSNSSCFTLIPYKTSFLKFANPTSVIAYYKNRRVNLLTNEVMSSELSDIQEVLSSIKFDQEFVRPRVIHCLYELGFFWTGSVDLIKDDELLMLVLDYSDKDVYIPKEFKEKINLGPMKIPSKQIYKTNYRVGQEYLKRGDCYQFNLTKDFQYLISTNNPEAIIGRVWASSGLVGGYGHATYLPMLNRLIMSNSPECLFQIKKRQKNLLIESMPIKGSIRWNGSNRDFKKKWKQLVTSEKNEAELFMITDLMRNDLSRIESPCSKVIAKKLPLAVSGIIHQYSKIVASLSYDVSLYQILKSLFPGGSVTGAPKKRVMEILRSVEKRSRGFYCGSTIILHKNIVAASVNIRTADIDLKNKKLFYGAGGGVTLLSSVDDEYLEMKLKVDSFMDIL